MSEQAPPPPPPPAGDTPPPPPPMGGQPTPGFAPDGREYAPWIWRVISYVIDYVPVAVLGLIGYIFFFSTEKSVTTEISGFSYTTIQSSGPGFLFWVLWLIGVIYWVWNKGYREGTTGKSIGKQLTGYTTVNESTGKPLGAGMGILRALLLYIEFALIGACLVGFVFLLWPLWDAKRQTLMSDKATGAVVFKD